MKQLEGNLYAPNESVTNYNKNRFESLEPGVYCCKIVQIRDEPEKEYLYVEYDIADGPHKGYYERMAERAGFWGGKVFLSYKNTNKNISNFKMALKAINLTNPGHCFNPFMDGENRDEKTLVGKLFWIVLHEEEYEKTNGSTGTRLTGSQFAIITEDDYKNGDFNHRLLEKTTRRPSTTTSSASDTPDFMDPDVDNPFQ